MDCPSSLYRQAGAQERISPDEAKYQVHKCTYVYGGIPPYPGMVMLVEWTQTFRSLVLFGFFHPRLNFKGTASFVTSLNEL